MGRGGRQVTYDAVLYAQGAVLGDLSKSQVGALLAEEMHKEFGRRLAKYLRAKDVTYQVGTTPEGTAKNILDAFLKRLDFARPEKAEPTAGRGTHAVWRDLPGTGTDAYAALAHSAIQTHFYPAP